LVPAIGALCYGYDTIYYTGIQGMVWFAKDYGEKTAEGSYELATTFLSVSASIIYVGEFVGAFLAAPINDFFGRRAVFLTASLCIVAGAIVQVCSFGSAPVFYVGRVLVGLGIGQFTATCLMYIGEVAPSAIRGPGLMCFQFMQSVSQLVGACINEGTKDIPSAQSYRIPMALLVVLPGIMLLCLPFTPETPVWYMYKDKREEAIEALRKINHSYPDYEPTMDIQAIDDQVQTEREVAQNSSWISLITDPIERRKPAASCSSSRSTASSSGTRTAWSLRSPSALPPPSPLTLAFTSCKSSRWASQRFSAIRSSGAQTSSSARAVFSSLVAVGGLGTTQLPDGSFSRGVGIGIVVLVYFNIVFYNFSIGTLSYMIASECPSAATGTRSPRALSAPSSSPSGSWSSPVPTCTTRVIWDR
jgi:MFS family permease